MGIELVVALSIFASPVLDEPALRARYGNLASLTAEVSQMKEGRYWARPMRSEIQLEWTPQQTRWKTISPVQSTVIIAGDALTVTDSHGSVRTLEGSADPRFGALVSLLRAFLGLDLPRIERDFILEFRGHDLVARARPDASVTLFKTVTFRFDDELDIRGVDLVSDSEQTHLAFRNVVRKLAGSP